MNLKMNNFQFDLKLIITLVIITVSLPITNGLKCYQCITSDSTPCNETYFKECPTDQAYDECSTTFKKTAGILQVVRKCVLGPCSLQDRNIPLSETCDMKSNLDFNCIHCCRSDGCNKNSVNTILPNKWLLYTFLLITILYCSLIKFKIA